MPSIHWGYNRQWKVPASASARQHPRTKRAALCFQRVDEVTYYVTGSCAAVVYRRSPVQTRGVPSGSGRLPIGRSLPSCPTTVSPAWRRTYAQIQAVLLMNRVGIHFCVAHPGLDMGLPTEFLAVVFWWTYQSEIKRRQGALPLEWHWRLKQSSRF